MAKQSEIQAALIAIAQPGVTSRQLRKEIEKAFPEASKKDIRLAAFAAMIAIVEKNPAEGVQLQDFALGTSETPVVLDN